MPSCLQQLGAPSGPIAPETVADLRTYLVEVPDPRARRGVRHSWTALLTAAAAAVLSGAASITAIGEWVADAPQRVLALLGFRPDPLTGLIRPPHSTTIRLVLAAADGDALTGPSDASSRNVRTRCPAGGPSPSTARHSAGPAPRTGRPPR
ncbi:transposase family protein [Streptomyces sp. NPDC058864]